VIIGDIKIHLGRPDDQATVSFNSILTTYNLVQIVQSRTHSAGHQIDVIVRSDLSVPTVNVPPPMLSNHSMISAELEMRCFQHLGSTFSLRRSWRSFDYSAFEDDLIRPTLICDTLSDIGELFTAYSDTQKLQLDHHAPFRRVRHSVRLSPVWYVVLLEAPHGR